MDYSAVNISQFVNNPSCLCGSYPLIASFDLSRTVNTVDNALQFQNIWYLFLLFFESVVVLKVQPGKESLQGSVHTTPSNIIKFLISVVKIFIDSSCVILQKLILFRSFTHHVRIKDFVRPQGLMYFGLLRQAIMIFQITMNYVMDSIINQNSCLLFVIICFFELGPNKHRRQHFSMLKLICLLLDCHFIYAFGCVQSLQYISQGSQQYCTFLRRKPFNILLQKLAMIGCYLFNKLRQVLTIARIYTVLPNESSNIILVQKIGQSKGYKKAVYQLSISLARSYNFHFFRLQVCILFSQSLHMREPVRKK